MTPIYNLPAIRGYSADGGFYYPYSNRSNDSVGAIRISYSYVPSGINISLIGKQNSDNTIDEMPTDKGELYVQYGGKMTLQEMLEKYRRANLSTVWMNRLIGFILMEGGLFAITLPIRFFAVFLRGAGKIVSFLNKLIVFVIAAVLSLCTIGIAWFAYRPELTFSILGGTLIIFGIIFLIKKKYNEQN